MKRLFLILILLTSTTCASRPPTRIQPRLIGTTTVRYVDGRILKYLNQYRPRVEGVNVVFSGPAGWFDGVNFLLIEEWHWTPNKPLPKTKNTKL